MAEQRRILQILPNLGTGGAERAMVDLTAGLLRSGFEVAAVSLYNPAETGLEAELAAAGVPVSYLGKSRGFDPRQFRRIARVLEGFRPHLVHTHRYALSYAWPAVHRRRVPCVHTVHNLAEKEVPPLHRRVFRKAYRGGVVPVAISSQVAQSLAQVYGLTDVPLIPNGIDVEKYQRGGAQREAWRRAQGLEVADLVCVTVGRLAPQKNYALLLRAFRQVADALPAARLLVAGEGVSREELEKLHGALGLADRVTFLGARADIPELLAAADLFVLSSDWEGHPLAVMEALAAGLPVVATAVGGVPEQVDEGRTGLLVPPGDPSALAAALLRLLPDAPRRGEMGERAREQAAARFSVERMTRSYEELYARLWEAS
jgi:glycosyltransferase involved in cell wall biosynthesis